MSQWTHVCGNIRVDHIRQFLPTPDFQEILGKILDYEDFEDIGSNPTTKLPCGSEGSIEWDVLVNPHESSVAAYSIPIWGDLRDYRNTEEIENWFKDVINKFIVRDAVLSIDVEFGPKIILTCKGEFNEMKVVRRIVRK